MVGVTSPLFRRGDVRGGRNLAIWYVVGTALAGTAVFLVLKAASVGVSAVPAGPRYLGLGACVAVLLVLDLLGRTPRVNRQTPQRLRTLPPGVRGFLWGLDIAAQFTTIKVTSLVWVLMLLCVADPRHAPLAVAVYYAAFLLTEAVAVALDLGLGPTRVFNRLQGRGLRHAARVASVALLVPVVAFALARGL
jgi:hypothetical protein